MAFDGRRRRIAVFGSTGATGRAIVEQALERGHDVTTLVRQHAVLAHPNLTTVQGELTDAGAIGQVVQGCDRVVSALGFKPRLFGEKTTTLYSTSARALVAAMTSAGVDDITFMTSAGVEDDPGEPWPYRHILKPLYLAPSYHDMQVAETILRESPLRWTIVRPSRLTNGRGTGVFRVSPRFRPRGGTAISRADVASFIVSQAAGSDWEKKTPTLAY